MEATVLVVASCGGGQGGGKVGVGIAGDGVEEVCLPVGLSTAWARVAMEWLARCGGARVGWGGAVKG